MDKKILMMMFVFVLFILQVQPQVLGIDFGTQFWKASFISPGKNLLIVENSRSERKTLNSVSFDEGLRFFESQSLFKRLKKPKASHFYLNRFIRSLDEQTPLPDYPFVNGTYLIDNDGSTMTLEQVVGQILRNLKSHANLQAGTNIRDCVITVPANWGRKAKLSLVNAAYLADLSVLGLVNQNSAAMINFVITRNDTEPINMVVFNYGSSNLQISVMKLWGYFDETKNKTIQSLQALSHVVVNDIGGLNIDRHIANYLADQFTKIYKIDPRSKERSFIKLLHKCSDAKEVLSANKQTKVYVEGLIDGIDLQILLKRQIIDNIQFFNKFNTYLGQALAKAGLTVQDISFVELIGGASRVKRVVNIVKQYFPNKEVGAHMNGDEAMAFGSALRAANLSRSLKVKPLHFYDIFDFQSKVIISTTSGQIVNEEILFTKNGQHGQKKAIVFNASNINEDLNIKIYDSNGQILKQYTTNNLTDWKDKVKNQNITEEPTITLHFTTSSVSLVDLKEVSVSVAINTLQVKQIQVDAPINDTDQSQQNKQNDQQQVDKDKEQAKKQGKDELNREQVLKMFEQSKKQKKIKKNISLEVPITKKHIAKIQEISNGYQRMSKEQIAQKQQIIQKFEANQKKINEKAKVRNDFESNLYRLKDMFQQDGGIKNFSTQQQWSQLQVVVHRQISWLDQNAWTATKQQFDDHFRSLFLSYQKIYNRTVQYQERQKVYNQTLNYLSITYQRAQELLTTHTWLLQKMIKFMTKINETAKWVNDEVSAQFKKALNENPTIYNHEYIEKAEKLRDELIKLKMTPQPKQKAKIIKPQETQRKQNADQTINLDDQENQENQNPKQNQKERNQDQNIQNGGQSKQNQESKNEESQNEESYNNQEEQNEQDKQDL